MDEVEQARAAWKAADKVAVEAHEAYLAARDAERRAWAVFQAAELAGNCKTHAGWWLHGTGDRWEVYHPASKRLAGTATSKAAAQRLVKALNDAGLDPQAPVDSLDQEAYKAAYGAWRESDRSSR